MTATDPRPALAAMLAERLAPAAAALAGACAADMGHAVCASPLVEGEGSERGVMPGRTAGHTPCACRT